MMENASEYREAPEPAAANNAETLEQPTSRLAEEASADLEDSSRLRQTDSPSGSATEGSRQILELGFPSLSFTNDPQKAKDAMRDGHPAPPSNAAAGEPSGGDDASVAPDPPDRTERYFQKYDADKNGRITQAEAAVPVMSKDVKGEEAQEAGSIYASLAHLKDVSDDDQGTEDNGMSREDLRNFLAHDMDVRRENALAAQMSNWNETGGFRNTDSNNDGFLHQEEIKKRMETQGLPAAEHEMLHKMMTNIESLQAKSDDEAYADNDGITAKDIAANRNQVQNSPLLKASSHMYHYGNRIQNAQAESSNELFGGADNPVNNIKPDGFNQGIVGNCYMEAVGAAVAATNPESIKDMISDNRDGTYTVTFPGAKDKPLTVTAPTEAEMGLYNKGSALGNWAGVIEKAFGEYQNQKRGTRGYTSQEGADGGGPAAAALELLTGNQSSYTYLPDKSLDAVAAAVKSAVKEGDPICCVASPDENGDKTKDGFQKNHVYTVLGIRQPQGRPASESTVIVRNPHGGEGSISEISVKQLRDNFTHIQTAKRKR